MRAEGSEGLQIGVPGHENGSRVDLRYLGQHEQVKKMHVIVKVKQTRLQLRKCFQERTLKQGHDENQTIIELEVGRWKVLEPSGINEKTLQNEVQNSVNGKIVLEPPTPAPRPFDPVLFPYALQVWWLKGRTT